MRLPRDTHMPDAGQFRFGIATPAAAGSSQATGTKLVSQINNVTAADGTKGVVLPSALKGMEVIVLNTSTTSALPVWPFAGDAAAINALSADASYSIGPDREARFKAESKTQWRVSGWAAGTTTTAEQNVLAGVVAGTVAAAKALVVDAGKALAGLLNLTFGAGTATVAPINLVAGTNLTTPVAGAVEFDGTAFYATAVANARQQVDAEQFTIATADSATYNNTGLDTAVAAPVFTATMNGSANGAITLVAGKTYAFEFLYNLTNTGTTAHTWATLFAGAATFTKFIYSVFGLSFGTANTPASGGLTGFSGVTTATVVTPSSTSATEQVTIQGMGVLVVNAGGTLIPQMQASARPGATGTPGVIVKAGSFFRIWEMGGALVGNWS